MHSIRVGLLFAEILLTQLNPYLISIYSDMEKFIAP